MFTGLIEEVGRVLAIQKAEAGSQLQVAAPAIAPKVGIGDSVAVNGCCLTVSAREDQKLTFDLLKETVDRTNLKQLRAENPVNLERALVAGTSLGGHFVQGHIDCCASVRAFEQHGTDYCLKIELPADFAHYVAFKGSIAVNGISLTVAEVSKNSFAVWIIPHTKEHTNLGSIAVGDLLNLEFDILAKYVERMMTRRMPQE